MLLLIFFSQQSVNLFNKACEDNFLGFSFWSLSLSILFLFCLRKLKKKKLLTVLHGMYYLSSASRDWTHAPLHWQYSLNHWITRKSQEIFFEVWNWKSNGKYYWWYHTRSLQQFSCHIWISQAGELRNIKRWVSGVYSEKRTNLMGRSKDSPKLCFLTIRKFPVCS